MAVAHTIIVLVQAEQVTSVALLLVDTHKVGILVTITKLMQPQEQAELVVISTDTAVVTVVQVLL